MILNVWLYIPVKFSQCSMDFGPFPQKQIAPRQIHKRFRPQRGGFTRDFTPFFAPLWEFRSPCSIV